jgi:cytochrome c556
MQIRALIGVALLSLPMAVQADEPTTLQQIMQDLSDDLVVISDGLLSHDLELVVNGAKGIAEHPQIPPEQVQLVARELGTEMPAFKQFDVRVHNLAVEIGAAASAGDREAAVSGFHRLVDGCLACHDAYKDRVAAVLRQD